MGSLFRGFFDRLPEEQVSAEFRRDYFTADELAGVAVVEETITPNNRGRVRFQGSSWFAMVKQNIQFLPGSRVLVVGQEGITLIVTPIRRLESVGFFHQSVV